MEVAAEVVEYRPLLFAIAYEMTGSATAAEDIVQDVYLRARQAGEETIRSPKAYLATITTRLALDYLKSARQTREVYPGVWLPEPLLSTDAECLPAAIVERREAIALAWVALLETLAPVERAVFVLHEVFAYPFDAVAPVVEKTTAACRQIFHRAQRRMAAGERRFAAPTGAEQALVGAFFAACEQGDLPGLIALLARDARLTPDGGGKAPSATQVVIGAADVARLCLGIARKAPAGTRLALVELNGGPAAVAWEQGVLTTAFQFVVVDGRIQAIYGLRNPDKLVYLGRQLARAGYG